jgi:hypothetical protein
MKTYWDLRKMPELVALPEADRKRILESTLLERPVRWATLKGWIVCGLSAGTGSIVGDLINLGSWHLYPWFGAAIGGGIGGLLFNMIRRAAWAKSIREAIHAEQGSEPNFRQ